MFAYSRVIRALLALFIFTAAGWAQVVGGSINGTVRDTTGAAVSGATITIRSVETGASREVASDAGGHYAAPSLPVGVYSVTASRDGFAAQARTGVRLVIGQSAAVDFSLDIGQVKQQVTVVSAPAAVELSTRQTSGLVDERQVKNLPLNGRSFDELITLNPAVVNYTSERNQFVEAASV